MEGTDRKELVVTREGKISRQMMEDWIRPLNVELRGAGTDESPHCYKRLPEVLNFHRESVRVLHTLKPLEPDPSRGSRDQDPAWSTAG